MPRARPERFSELKKKKKKKKKKEEEEEEVEEVEEEKSEGRARETIERDRSRV